MPIFKIFLINVLLFIPTFAQAFCGFYVSREDGALFNEASKVVFARNGTRSTITMASDYQGSAKDFAMIVPTPAILERKDIRVVKPETITHIDNYTAPRLVEYHDYDPCAPLMESVVMEEHSPVFGSNEKAQRQRGAAALGVTIAAEYQVGIYDILMLKAKQSDGLITWLKQEGYKIPDGGEGVVHDYIKGGMKFFVARVNLKRHASGKKQELSPLQITFRSKDFMLPIRLGKINSTGAQDLLLYTLTSTGRVELANYDEKRIPTDQDIPVFTEKVFAKFYQAMFDKLAPKSGAFLEYAWDMAWCDPCAADPLSYDELRELGALWVTREANSGQNVFVTRLHIRYGPNSFKNDLILRRTKDRENFQGRYVMNHPFEGKVTCEAGREYVREKRKDIAQEKKNLHNLTGWSRAWIAKNVAKTVPAVYR